MNDYILRLEDITKEYSGVKALDSINLNIEKGKIHSIVGENGAGKSTFIKIITGAQKQTKGKIFYKGNEITHNNPYRSMKNGIGCVYQELNVIQDLTICENIFYGYEETSKLFLDKKTMKEKSKNILKDLGVNLDVNKLVKDIGIGNQQIVEIAKSLIRNVEVLILDEPTSSLTKKEIDNLFHILGKLKEKGVTIIYISHRLEEVLQISDTVTVFRDGKLITKDENKNLNQRTIIKNMVGRDLHITEYSKDYSSEEIVLKAENISNKSIKNISFELKKGEILGITGLVASGRTELANAIFGVDKITQGKIYINNKHVIIDSPSKAIENGLGFITEDRKDTGLMLEMSIKDNASISSLKNFTKGLFINKEKQLESVEGKWLLTNSDIIIFDEPTRGIDVSAKEEVYKIIEKLAREGKSIIMISSEIEEVFRMSNRILVMSNGQIVSQYKNGDVSSEQIFIDSSSLLRERDYE